MTKEEISIKEVEIQNKILTYTGELPSKITIHLRSMSEDTFLLNIHISTVNDKDDSKYYLTKGILQKWNGALLKVIPLDCKVDIRDIGFL